MTLFFLKFLFQSLGLDWLTTNVLVYKKKHFPPMQGLEKVVLNQNPVKSLCQSASETPFSMRLCLRIYFSKKGGGSE